MTESKALGFWSKHCWSMDQFYDDEDLPEELQAIRENESNQAILNELISATERDVEWLLKGIQKNIESELARKHSPFKIAHKRSNSVWVIRMDLEPRRGSLPKGPIQLGLEISSAKGDRLFLCLWLWTRGGRAAEHILQTQLDGAIEGSSIQEFSWSRGVALLCNMPIDADQFRGTDGLSVDLQKLQDHVMSRLQSQTNARLQSLIHALRR